MVLKNVFTAILCTTLLAWSGSSIADEYRADEFLGLDLSTAVLSPKRLGPESEFAPVAIEARTDRTGTVEQARVEPEATTQDKVQAKPLANAQAKPHAKIAVARPGVRHGNGAQLRAEKPRGMARTRLAHRHGNPLDAQAQDTRIQSWPCKSGGICNWK
jgi:hypothetical protein